MKVPLFLVYPHPYAPQVGSLEGGLGCAQGSSGGLLVLQLKRFQRYRVCAGQSSTVIGAVDMDTLVINCEHLS